jgi:hypothetical protein
MLKLYGEDFALGRARFFDDVPERSEPTPKIFVKIALGGPESPLTLLAQLDTGSAWSILDRESAADIGLLTAPGPPRELRTPLGIIKGRLVAVPVELMADEGTSLDIEAVFFISEDWPGKTFLGYSGLLERIRFALDPPKNDFYFGEPGEFSS